jgi:hypothetical protein
MPSLSERSQQVANAFQRYVKRDDMSQIASFTREEIERTLTEYARDAGYPHYIAMQQRVEKLKDIERRRSEEAAENISRKLSRWEKLKWALIGGVVTIVAGLIVNVIWIRIKHWFE